MTPEGKPSLALQDRIYRAVAKILARRSHCDSVGSVEYHRVFAEWVQAGRPANITEFIMDHANRGP